MHSLLARQIKKSKIDSFSEINSAKFAELISLISSMYKDHDEETLAIQHTMQQLNLDMTHVYEKLKGRMSAVAETMPDMMALINGNSECIELFSIGEQKIFSKEEFDDSLSNIHNLFKIKYGIDVLKVLVEEAVQTKKLQMLEIAIDNYIIDINIMTTGLIENDQTTLILSLRDVTEQRISYKKLEFLAIHDSLTGLYNRRFFQTKLQELMQNKITNTKIAILYLDLNKFKEINDIMGHDIGDEILKESSKRLLKVKRNLDFLFRMGGDEFVYICLGIKNKKEIKILSEVIEQEFNRPFIIDGKNYSMKTSIGVSFYPDDTKDLSQLVNYADEAMFYAKKEANVNCYFFQKKIADKIEKRRTIEHKIRSALENDAFYLVFQPQVELDTQKIIGVETLIRWVDKELGFIPPDKFIKIAEQSSLIFQIDEWVVKNSCKIILKWQKQNLPPFKVAINLSRRELGYRKNIENIISIIKDSGINSQRFEFEITESALFENEQKSIQNLKLLKDFGCSISIDDFGTGYSSLANLRNFAFDKIKIDKSFIDGILLDKYNLAIIKSTINLAKNLDIPIIAEGVEDKRQYTLLKELACDQIQGYYFYKPLAEEVITSIPVDKFKLTTFISHLSKIKNNKPHSPMHKTKSITQCHLLK